MIEGINERLNPSRAKERVCPNCKCEGGEPVITGEGYDACAICTDECYNCGGVFSTTKLIPLDRNMGAGNIDIHRTRLCSDCEFELMDFLYPCNVIV